MVSACAAALASVPLRGCNGWASPVSAWNTSASKISVSDQPYGTSA